MESFKIGDKIVVKTNRLTDKRILRNDIAFIKAYMARGGFQIEDTFDHYMGIVRKSDIKYY